MPGTGKEGNEGRSDDPRDRSDRTDRRDRGDRGERGERRGPRIAPKGARRRPRYEKPSDLVESLITRYGSRDRAIEELAQQTYDLREDRRELEEDIEDLEKRVAPDDAVVLTGDEKKKWEAVKAIDLPGEKIAERVKKADELETKDQKAELSKKRKEVATAADMNGDALDPLLEQFGLEVELRPVVIMNGNKSETKQIAHVRPKGDDKAPWEKLSDFVAKDGSPLKPFEVVLKSKTTTQQTGGTAGGGTGGGGTIPFPSQTGGGGGTQTGGAVDSILKRRSESANRPNPLSTRQPADKGTAAAS